MHLEFPELLTRVLTLQELEVFSDQIATLIAKTPNALSWPASVSLMPWICKSFHQEIRSTCPSFKSGPAQWLLLNSQSATVKILGLSLKRLWALFSATLRSKPHDRLTEDEMWTGAAPLKLSPQDCSQDHKPTGPPTAGHGQTREPELLSLTASWILGLFVMQVINVHWYKEL